MSNENKITFSQRLRVYNDAIELIDEQKEGQAGIYRFKPGVTPETLMEKMGYNQKPSLKLGLKEMAAYARFCTMKVEHRGETVYGEELQERCNVRSKSKFLEFCEANLNPENPNKVFTKVADGVKFPQFSGRQTSLPSALGLMNLLSSIQTEDENV